MLAFAVGAGSAIFMANRQPSQYKATAKVFVGPQSIDPTNAVQAIQQLTSSREFLASYAELLRSRTLAGRAIERLGLSVTPSALAGQIQTSILPETRIVLVSATDSNPEQAALLANTLSDIFVDEISKTFKGTQVSVFEPAISPVTRISPRPGRDGMLGGILGLMLGVAAALVLSQMDTRIRTREDVEHTLSPIPVLAEVPSGSGSRGDLFIQEDPKSPAAEAFRILRTNVQFLGVDRPIRRVLVTSPYAEDGKTTVATNLAASLAAAGYRTLIMDADLRRPMIHTYFKLPPAPGITDVLIGNRLIADAIRQTNIPSLYVLTSGAPPPNPSELLGSQRMVELIDQASELVDIVIIDTPPTLPVTDAAVLGPQTDGIILVLRAGRSPRERAKTAVAQFERAGVRTLGVVLNGADRQDSSYYYYYYSDRKSPKSNGSGDSNGAKIPPRSDGAETPNPAEWSQG